MACHFCYNAHVWAKEPHTEEDYFDEGLHDDNDGSSCGIGHSAKEYQMYFNSGMGVPCNIEVCRWHEGYGWAPIAKYYPKYCPECGRKLDEYIIGERGGSFEKVEATYALPESKVTLRAHDEVCPSCGNYSVDGNICVLCQKKAGVLKTATGYSEYGD